MTLAPPRIGIDISKSWLDIFDSRTTMLARIANKADAIARFVATLAPEAVVVFEATAPYDLELRKAVSGRVRAQRVNLARARAFARAAGVLAKTDRIDARMLTRDRGRRKERIFICV